jgi:hypothetical protein
MSGTKVCPTSKTLWTSGSGSKWEALGTAGGARLCAEWDVLYDALRWTECGSEMSANELGLVKSGFGIRGVSA